MSKEVNDDDDDHQRHQFCHRSSAYVQHLAEACAILTKDSRWRTATDKDDSSSTLLFSVERGDDVSAVKALASLYDGPMSTTASTTTDLKGDDEGANRSFSTTNQKEDSEVVFERAMHLYSRMFVRKGPWFDLADLYARYYYNVLKKESRDGKMQLGRENENENEVGDSFNNSSGAGGLNDDDDNHNNEHEDEEDDDEKKVHKFFKPRRSLSAMSSSSSGAKSNTKNHSSNRNTINEDILSSHRIGLENLFCDIYHLHSMGLLRSFHSEYECGFISGHVDEITGRGTLLSAEERREVLFRCGGGGKNKSRRSLGATTTTASASLSSTTTTSAAARTTNSNEILNHMQSQQSLLASFFVSTTKSTSEAKRQKRASYPSSNKTKLLPVAKHVDAVLLRKLAVRVITLSSPGQFNPPRKSEVEQALRIVHLAQTAALQHSIGKHNHRRNNDTKVINLDDDDDDDVICLGNGGGIGSAFRLREAPLKTLRRCMRLFLCAGSGPGAMRGDGANGWISVLDDEARRNDDDACRTYSSSSRWHNVVYPGLNSRFGLEFYELSRCYTPILSNTLHENLQFGSKDDGTVAASNSALGPFSHNHEFQLWEIGVELRSFIDRVYEAYERDKQQSRRRSRDERETLSSSGDGTDGENAMINLLTRNGFTLLNEDGRRDFVESILAPCFNEAAHSPQHIALNQAIYNLSNTIEADILSLSSNTTDDVEDVEIADGFVCDTERLIVAFAIICWRILEVRIEHPSAILASLVKRPWLRHMSFDSILAYIVWDCVPIFERRGQHIMAVSILQTIIFGRDVLSHFDDPQLWSERLKPEPYVECLLPRRNRGKACERLLIDITHMERRAKKNQSTLDKKEKKKSTGETNLLPAHSLCNSILRIIDSIPFCSLRNLARRSKAALPQTTERLCLLIRLNNDDWSPRTDCAVANSLTISRDGSESAAGKRCAFVGWEMHDEDGETMEAHRSLNVEELAMEEYHHGRLPRDTEEVKGQWVGWHDEGAHVRALFRIICLQHDLIEHRPPEGVNLNEQMTVILTPYQNSPHDLHVGHFQTAAGFRVRGFYERRRAAIEEFLSRLTNCDAGGISKIVYDAVKKRWDSHVDDRSRLKDPRLVKDVTELKTLSMIASALGPVALSRIFRTLCFDYRHWSGGLPDLFLVRAYDCESPIGDSISSSPFIQLADWIGEGFSQSRIDEKNLRFQTSMLSDRDDEFLGQPKSADGFPSQQQNPRRKNNSIASIQLPSFPDMLEFVHEERRVRADCMFVEVKSANDRLSERQEDWLSILESSTNARVCKFTNSPKVISPVGELLINEDSH